MQTLSTTHPLHAGTLPGSVGVEHEEWYAEARCSGDRVTVTMMATDPCGALVQLVTSGDHMDQWFKDEVRKLTGVSLAAMFGHVLTPRHLRH